MSTHVKRQHTSAPLVKRKRKKTQRMKESQQQNKNKKVKRSFKPPAPSQDKPTTKDTVSKIAATTKDTASVPENATATKDTVSATENVATTKDSDNEFIVPPPPAGFPNYESMTVIKSVWSSSHGVQCFMTRFLPDDKQWGIKNLFMSIIDKFEIDYTKGVNTKSLVGRRIDFYRSNGRW